jgi:dihydrofolate reductase
MTRKIILQIDVTVDGFIAGANGDTSWVNVDGDMMQAASDLLDTVDTILLGRVAYQDFITFWPSADDTQPTTFSRIVGQINHADKLIFSRTLSSVEWGKWNNARLIRDDIPAEMARLKSQPGKSLLLYAGADIISTFMQHDLIDEYHLRVHPIIVGQGKRLFPHLDHQTKLSHIKTTAYANGSQVMEYRRV